jgi:putative glutathione S-transferase
VIVRMLKGLEDAIGISYLHPFRDERGWAFPGGRFVDEINGFDFLAEAYEATTRTTSDASACPCLLGQADQDDRQQRVGRDHPHVRLGVRRARRAPELDLYPEPLREEIDAVIAWVYSEFNNGVYRAGFSKSQRGLRRRVRPRVRRARAASRRCSASAATSAGDVITEADWRLFPTLVRFDAVYHTHFRCNGRRIVDCPNTWAYARELFQRPGIADTGARWTRSSATTTRRTTSSTRSGSSPAARWASTGGRRTGATDHAGGCS